LSGRFEHERITGTLRSRADSAVETAIVRMESEYREMPGLVLTRRQAERLLGLDDRTCALAFATLTHRRFLKQTANGAYLRERAG
jgi:hypothetical protein